MGSHNLNTNSKSSADDHGHVEGQHVTPFNVYVKIAAALFGLTFLTVAAHSINQYLQPFASLIAFSIAAVKAYLVMAFFMHLKYETKMNRAIFFSGYLFLALLFIMCVIDIYTRLVQNSVL